MRIIKVLITVICLAGLISPPLALAAPHNTNSWSFGVISDTQWTKDDDGYNPNTVAANIIAQIDQKFIEAGVKLVIAVGDTCDSGSQVNIDTRALYAQTLYNAGIGFYPLRGNHEAAHGSYVNSGLEMRYAFPQIGTGINNNTPADITTDLIPAEDLVNNPAVYNTGSTFKVGNYFSEPASINYRNNSVSYAFRFNNATFMLLDQFNVDGEYYPSTIANQMDWINSTLSSRPANTHAFVFAHKNILGGNHKDNMFGGPINNNDPGDGYGIDFGALTPEEQEALAAKQAAENEFIASMQANDVPVVVSGHDHHHHLSLVTSPDGQSHVHQLITQSDSSKFYTPREPASANDVPIQQDLDRIGYYIFTVDGTQVTIDYYGDATGGGYYGPDGGSFNFVKMSTVTYNLNGLDPIVAQGASYSTTIDDTTKASAMEHGFKGTSMSILAGTNGDTSTTNYGKAISKDVTTCWERSERGLASDILALGGMSMLPGDEADQYVLSMSCDDRGSLRHGNFGIAAKDEKGNWVNAVNMNVGGGRTEFVSGPWESKYGLGAYGVDPATRTAWAVINYDGSFAIGRGIVPQSHHRR